MRLGKAFFQGREDPVKMAPALLGQVLVSEVGGVRTAGRIVEVEAYLAIGDAASHAARKKLPAALLGGPGTLYVHPMRQWCGLDIVCGAVGEAGSVLIRALEPVEGLDVMVRRAAPTLKLGLKICSGPARLCRALGITRELNGASVLAVEARVWLAAGPAVAAEDMGRSLRIGLGIGGVQKLPLRFYVHNSSAVSGQRRF